MKILGWVATFMSVMMYVSCFPTNRMDNLMSHKGNFVQALSQPSTLAFGFTTDSSKRTRYSTYVQPMPGIIFGFDHSHHSLVINERESRTKSVIR